MSKDESKDESMTIASGKVVALRYVLKDDQGKVRDEAKIEAPFYYLHGHRNIVPGLEEALVGKGVGDHVEVAVPPDKGYGKRWGKPQKMRRSEFPDDALIEKGARFTVRTKEGKSVPIWITKVMGASITVDHNHPLADQTLHFDVHVLSIRDASEEEIQHGHAHGPDAHGGHGHGHGDGDGDGDGDRDGAGDEDGDGHGD